jgi:hypothetical protein
LEKLLWAGRKSFCHPRALRMGHRRRKAGNI